MIPSRTKALLGLRLSPSFPAHQALRAFATTRSYRQKPSRFPPDQDLEAQLADLQKHLDEHKNHLSSTPADRRTQKRLQAELDFLQTFVMLRTYAQETTSAPSSSSSPASATEGDSVKRNEELFWQLRMLWRTNVDSTYHTLMAPSGEVPVTVRAKRVFGFVIISVATGLTYPLSWIIRALP